MRIPRQHSPSPSMATMFDAFRADYDIARQSRFRRRRAGVSGAGRSADYHCRTEPGWLYAMEVARDLDRNNIVVGQGVRRLVANVIQDGLTPDPKTTDKELDKDLAARWWDWAEDEDACDVQGERIFHDMEQAVLHAAVVDGDMIGLPLDTGQLQLLEAHRCRTPNRTKRNIVRGVQLDESRRRLKYWITKEDLDPLRGGPKAGDMTAYDVRDGEGNRQVFHAYLPGRVSATRGFTALAPTGDNAGMGDDLFFAQLVKAQVASCYTIFRELAEEAGPSTPGQRGEETTETRPDGTTRTIQGLSPGLEIFGFRGEKLQGFSPNVPNAEFFQHATLILTFLAINLDLPLCLFLLDSTKTNFSGFRGALDQARQRFRIIQSWLAARLHRPTWKWKLRQWAAEDPALATARARLGDKLFFSHEWNPPAWRYIEPLTDATADMLRVRGALTSQRRRCAEQSILWDDLSTEICEDNGGLIEKAWLKAQELSQKHAGLDVTWREVISVPTPGNVTMAVNVGGPGQQNQQQEPANGS